MYKCPLFNTHHAPVGAWASLTFGAPDKGLSIDLQNPALKSTAALMVGCADEEGLQTIGFMDVPKENTADLAVEGAKDKPNAGPLRERERFGFVAEEDIERTLTPSKDTYISGKVSFTTYTPYDALPDPREGAIPALSCLPGILMDVTVDNTRGTRPCTAFFGLKRIGVNKTYAAEQDGLLTMQYRNEWAFSAKKEDGVFLCCGNDACVRRNLTEGTAHVHMGGFHSFFGLNVPAGEQKTLTVCWSVCAKEGSNGTRTTTYYYNRYFNSVLDSAQAILDQADRLRMICDQVDGELLHEGQDPARAALFSQAVRGYYASTQLLEDGEGTVRWNVCEGGYLWRNTMDLCADHIVWELRRNPWIVRCLMDEFIADYSYTDTVTYPGLPGEYPGGISFTHDMGNYFTYSPRGYSGYEDINDSRKGFYFYMTTEELLNGIYCLAGYVLHSKDVSWLQTHNDLLPKLMESLENRDGPNPEHRNGILKASTTRGGKCALESTTYDALDHSLLEAAGNVYVYIKTWCSLILMRHLCQLAGDDVTAARATAMLEKCRSSVPMFRSDAHPWLKANAYQDLPGAVAAAAEPLAVPYMLGVLNESAEPELFALLRDHSTACLQIGVCRDAVSGGLRLSSTSRNTWPSKAVLTVYAMERVLGLTMPEGLVQEIIGWAQVSGREKTIGDQIHCDTREQVGGPYYPRIVTAALWLQP